MDSGAKKSAFILLAALAAIFGAVSLAESPRAAGLVLAVMGVCFVPLAVVTIRRGNSAEGNYLVHVAWYLAVIFAAVAWLVSLKAALITVGVWLALLVLGFVMLARDLKAKGGLDPGLFVDIKLTPQPARAARHPEAFEGPAAELAELGFVPAGFFKDLESGVYVEGWADPERKIYASLRETVTSPEVNFSAEHDRRLIAALASYYDDGSSFGVTAGALGWPAAPEGMVRQYLEAEVAPGRMLAALLESRPAEGLREARPEGFQAVTEEDMTREVKLNLSKYYQESGNPAVVEAPPIKLQPLPERNLRNLEAVEALAVELADLGFVPAGFFKMTGYEIYVEGWVDPERKIYASICECGQLCPPYVEMISVYADRPGFTVSASPLPGSLDLPEEFLPISRPNARPAELLPPMLEGRPAEGLREVSPEGFPAALEEEGERMAGFIKGRPDK